MAPIRFLVPLTLSAERGLEPGARDVPSHALNLPLSVSLRDRLQLITET